MGNQNHGCRDRSEGRMEESGKRKRFLNSMQNKPPFKEEWEYICIFLKSMEGCSQNFTGIIFGVWAFVRLILVCKVYHLYHASC